MGYFVEGAGKMTIEEILYGESKNVEFKAMLPKDSIKYIRRKHIPHAKYAALFFLPKAFFFTSHSITAKHTYF